MKRRGGGGEVEGLEGKRSKRDLLATRGEAEFAFDPTDERNRRDRGRRVRRERRTRREREETATRAPIAGQKRPTIKPAPRTGILAKAVSPLGGPPRPRISPSSNFSAAG